MEADYSKIMCQQGIISKLWRTNMNKKKTLFPLDIPQKTNDGNKGATRVFMYQI